MWKFLAKINVLWCCFQHSICLSAWKLWSDCSLANLKNILVTIILHGWLWDISSKGSTLFSFLIVLSSACCIRLPDNWQFVTLKCHWLNIPGMIGWNLMDEILAMNQHYAYLARKFKMRYWRPQGMMVRDRETVIRTPYWKFGINSL